jgi:predicted Zn finger-like uncharacterized protein
MLIACPSCASTYSLTRDQLGAEGRSVRCARCRETWFAATADATPEEGDIIVEEPIAPPAPKTRNLDAVLRVPLKLWQAAKAAPASFFARLFARLSSRLRFPGLSSGTAAGALLVALIAVLLLQRETIVRLAPQTARLYAALAMPVNLHGLEFDGLKTMMAMDEDQPMLIVQGEIRNIRPGAVDVPPIRVMLRTADGRDIYEWTADAPRTKLDSGQSVVFRTRLASPPTDGREVLVRFAELQPQASSAR